MASSRLMSPKPFSEFNPMEYHEYVRSMYFKKEPRKAKSKKKEFTYGRTKKGNLRIKVNREPMWLSADEIMKINIETGIPRELILFTLSEKGIEVKE